MNLHKERRELIQELRNVIGLFADDATYFDDCCENGNRADLPIEQVLASVECRSKRCLELIAEIQDPLQGQQVGYVIAIRDW